MRLSIHGSLSKGTRELCVVLRGREVPDFGQIRALGVGRPPCMVALGEQRESRSGKVTLCYDVSSYMSLRSVLRHDTRRPVPLRSMLTDTVAALDWCADNVRGATLVLYDPRYVYVDDGGHLRFVLLPIRGYARQDEQSPFVLLGALADLRHSKGRSPNERELARRLLEFVATEGQAFSLNRLRSFVRAEHTEGRDPPVSGTAGGRTGFSGSAAGGDRYLLCRRSNGATLELVESRTYELGRGQACDVRLGACPRVSRRHASIRCTPYGVQLKDLGSTNGTYVEGRRLRPLEERRVAYGCCFLLSDQEFSVQRGET